MSFKINIFVSDNFKQLNVSDDLMVFPSKDILFLIFLYFQRNASWNFDGLATISLSLNHFMAVFISSSSLLEMASKSFPQTYRVVSFTKLQSSFSFIKRSKSLMKTLKRIGPSIDPCGTPRIISKYSLGEEPSIWRSAEDR